MKYILVLIVLCGFGLKASGQNRKNRLKGQVTFVTSKNVYVKFESTSLIKVGDSLYVEGNDSPCLLVKNKSSKSLVCEIINGCTVKKDATVVFKYSLKKDKDAEVKTAVVKTKTIQKTVKNNPKEVKNLERISGKISASTYSNFYTNRDNRHRFMTRFSMFADHINNSKFSFETYLNIRKETHTNSDNKPLNIYSLSLKYKASPTLSVAVGRKINTKTSSLGAIDGLQAEKHFGKNYVGVIAGFRPDITDYGFNADLFQYGLYVGRKTSSTDVISETTFGFIEQQNKGKVDRKYTYFQHSSTFFNTLNLYSSFELDVFENLNGVITNNFRLTNLYMSARYRFNRKVNFSLSYDSRKRIIYYETFRSEVERMLSDDLSRQGLRFRLNFKPYKYVNAGVSYSSRFQSDNQNKSQNINAYVSMYKLPKIGGSFSVHYNRNTSNYLTSNILSLRHYRTILKDKVSSSFYLRAVGYTYTSNEQTTMQYYLGTDLSTYIGQNLRLSLYAEYLKSDVGNSYRINTRIVKRFNNKKKKKKNYAY
ncbi:MAG: hypothetical protein L3J45_10170 [Flavobacteriaceae bacterium]|nr:hypothetical protein [Flavobacteriaceae bacterium]